MTELKTYQRFCNAHPGAMVFVRMGDFYECFSETAREVSSLIGIPLAIRGGIEVAGFPVAKLCERLHELSHAGWRRAVMYRDGQPTATYHANDGYVKDLATGAMVNLAE